VDAAVVELDALPDPVGSPAQHHDPAPRRLPVRAPGVRGDAAAPLRAPRVRGVGGVVVLGSLDAAHGHRRIPVDDPVGEAAGAQVGLVHPQDPGQVGIAEAGLLGGAQQAGGQVGEASAERLDLRLDLDQRAHLLVEPRLDVGALHEVVDRRPRAQRLVQQVLPVGRRVFQAPQQLGQPQAPQPGHIAEPRAPVLEPADRLAQRLGVGRADAHHLADRAHLGAEPVDGTRELLERPAGELGDDVVAARRVTLQGAVAPVRDLVEREPRGQQRRHHRDGEPGRLGRQR